MEAGARSMRFRMRVHGMTCPSCEHHVEKALGEAGAHNVEADFRRGEALLSVDGPPDEATLAAAVQRAGYASGPIEPLETIAPGQANLVEYRLPVEGMTCADCERHVADALLGVGATGVQANFRRGEAHIEAPARIDPARFVAALTETPYRPGIPERVTAEHMPARPTGHTGSGDRYDLAIVGSGGGAFAAAIAATERGAKVVMIERGILGGTCVNIGCVPSKTQLRAGELFWRAGHHPFQGIRTRAESVDLATLVEEKEQLVATLRREKYENLVGEYGWELVRGEARFEDNQRLRVDGRVISADAYLLATGARPAVPPIPGLSGVDFLTSTSLLDLKSLPEHLIVIGAGYIGLELGQFFHDFGSRVTLVQRGARLLRSYDPEIAESITSILQGQGIDVVTGATFVRAAQSGTTKRVVVRVGTVEQVIEGDALLVATGRTPNTEALTLGAAGVNVGARGEILVDDRLRTSNARVFAAGDVTLGPQYVYVAAHEGALAAENALGGDRVVDLRAVPGVTFTTPSIATVGLTEEAARRAGHDVKATTLPLDAVPRALVNREPHGLFKVVADTHTDEVLGVHVVAENAGDVIYAGVLAVRFHLTVRDLTDTFAPYLTMSEGLKLAAQSFTRDPSKLSCCSA
jgi:mercuric reductase